MSNVRIFYAVESVGVAQPGVNTFIQIHGLQQCGINTRFNLEQVFEIGQLNIYENVENIPEVEVTLEKAMDGYPPIYTLVTYGSTAANLVSRTAQRSTIGLSIYSDLQQSASGTPFAQCTVSGVYVSSMNWTFGVQGHFTEAVSLVGNNKWWNNTFTATPFLNNDQPYAINGSGGVNMRQDFLLGESSSAVSYLPQDIPGVTASGTVSYNSATAQFSVVLQSAKVSCNVGRDEIFQLGRRGVYARTAKFPIEVRTDIEVLATTGDNVVAYEDTPTTVDRKIYFAIREGTKLDLGVNNRLTGVTYGGANAQANGGNATTTFNFVNFSNLVVTHPQDPGGLTS